MHSESTNKANPVDPGAQIEKNIATIAYLTLVGLIVAFIMNNDKKDAFASFHIGQSLGLGITGIALVFVNIIPVLGWIVSIIGCIILFILWVSGLVNALNAKQKPVPILGQYYQKWFANI